MMRPINPKEVQPPQTHAVLRERIEVTGVVQGVGFRPFVHRLATAHGLRGYVLNGPDGVTIEAEGPRESLNRFARALETEAPPLSRIVSVIRTPLRSAGGTAPSFEGFDIRSSQREGRPVTLIPPDTATCDDCLRELFDPGDRRYLHPFITCTNCGPRFTIITGLPYDRPSTTMAGFSMCDRCRAEYTDPAHRRFHAQPIACPDCGPQLRLVAADGSSIPSDPVVASIELLRRGRILAIKGIGGFHLAVDGTNEAAVRRLRELKHREQKPFALMAGSLAGIRRLVTTDPAGEAVLTGRERPIVLQHRRGDAPAAPSVAPGNPFLGVMLPYAPLHYLLFFHPDAGGDFTGGTACFDALVMTSGNLSEEPICRGNEEALERLGGIADAFLLHDRPIHVRADDSVVRVVSGTASFIRRSRGYVPVPVFLDRPAPQVFAAGGELKNTMCFTDGRRAFVGQHIGDLENLSTMEYYREAADHFAAILGLHPPIVAYDLHPRYLSTQYARERIAILRENGGTYGAVGVQHHHAHIASVLAETGHAGPVIGFSLDGTGYGLDGTIWGGEVLVATASSFTRAAHLHAVSLPGGEQAIREPWRMAFSWLRETFGGEWRSLDLPCLRQVPASTLDLLDRAADAGINSPATSSLGRLFDAAASILNVRHTIAYEGQAAIMLDLLAQEAGDAPPLPYAIRETAPDVPAPYPVIEGELVAPATGALPELDTAFVLDYRPAIRALAEGVIAGTDTARLAAAFHAALIESFAELVRRLRELTGIGTVAISGGSWQNRILSERFPARLASLDIEVIGNRLVPPNDGGVALGQAFVAASVAKTADTD